MPVDMAALAGDVSAESAVTRDLIAGLDEASWHAPTPAAGWTIADQVSHLAYFDEVTVRSAVDPMLFLAELAAANAAGGIDPDAIAARFRDLSGAQLFAWFDEARQELLATFAAIDPAARLPWFGPAMSAASSLTARLMETWAHTQDIADTLGVTREPTGRLRHVAHIGVGARAYSYAVRGRPQPPAPVRVELIPPPSGSPSSGSPSSGSPSSGSPSSGRPPSGSPSPGAAWTWGPADATDRVTGLALDFCLLVTQRRHRDDLALVIEGPAAADWMAIAQAFAGPASTGRPAGMFPGR
jgi:uncharacterized protein (TIGR03084 family)